MRVRFSSFVVRAPIIFAPCSARAAIPSLIFFFVRISVCRHRHDFIDSADLALSMRRILSTILGISLLLGFAGAEEDKAPFNKEELEKLLRAEHSQRISNIYDNEAGIQ